MNEHSMRCVDWTPDHLHGLILVALLHSWGIDARLFDENFVRQNWLKTLAYGGFRIVVPAKDLQSSREILADCRRGALQSPDEESERADCPACHSRSVGFDHRQRRWIFLAYLTICILQAVLLIADTDRVDLYLGLELLVVLAKMMPWLLRYIVNNRLRCSDCLHAWRELPRTPFARQQQEAELASAATSS